MSKRDPNTHYETLDPKPLAIPARIRPVTDVERLRAMVRGELSLAAQADGFETFEEANDFDVGDDYDPTSPWELTIDQEIEHEQLVSRIIREQNGEEGSPDPQVSEQTQRGDTTPPGEPMAPVSGPSAGGPQTP